MIHSFDFKFNKWRRFRKAAMISLLTCTFTAATLGNAFPVRAEKGNSATESSQNGENSGAASSDEKVITGYDVVYVIDNSKSVWGQSKERNNAFRQITEEAKGKDVRIGVVYFADHVYDQLFLTSMEEEDSAAEVLDFLNMTDTDDENIDTNIGTALEAAIDLLGEKDENREQVVVLFSDGINENASGDKSYKEEADAKTKAQVEILEANNVPVYCVYLQKVRNDEAYLKKLVNYFSDRNHYDGERFEKVTSDKIEKLSDSFATLYKNLENEVEVRQEESSMAESSVTESQETAASTEAFEETTTETAKESQTEAKTEAATEAEPDTEAKTEAAMEENTTSQLQTEESLEESGETALTETAATTADDDNSDTGLVGKLLGKAALVGLLGLLLAAAAAIFYAMTIGVKKAKKNSKDSAEFKVDNDFGALRMQFEWTLDDFENACDKWKLYEPEIYRVFKKGRISVTEKAGMDDGMEELAKEGAPIIEAMQALIEENKDKFFENGKTKLDIEKVKEVNEQLTKGTDSLKEITKRMAEILKKAEDLIL